MPTRVERGRDREPEDETPAMTDLFAEVKQESTRTKVYTALREAIISGKLRTGQKLTEIGLATTFKVSRSIIREALRELVRDGLVEQNAYKSTTVVRLTPEQVDEILTVRLLLESEAVRLAHARLTNDDRVAAARDGRRTRSGEATRTNGTRRSIWPFTIISGSSPATARSKACCGRSPRRCSRWA